MSAILNSDLLKKFLKAAGERLKGEWLLVGGTLLPAVGIDVRSTVDIDLIGLGKTENAQILELMEVAETLGLNPETINPAAAIFLKKIKYQKEDLIILYKGSKGTIYRPSLMLYWQLKMNRLSETDLQDCEHYLAACKKADDKINLPQLFEEIQARLEKENSKEKLNRLKTLARLCKD